MDEPGYRPVPVAPDPERDKRVAARRRADAIKAGLALGDLLNGATANDKAYLEGYREGFADGYSQSELHHNGHYGVPPCTCHEPSGMSGCEQHMPVKLRRMRGPRE